MTPREMFVHPMHEDKASEIVHSISDPVTQNLVGVGFAKARSRFVFHINSEGEEFLLPHPAESFDMEFYVQILWTFFSQSDLLRRILAGEVVSPAPIVHTPLALNEDAAERGRLSISDPIARNLVTAALNEARCLFVRLETPGDAEPIKPPCLPFDMEFFTATMEEYFSMLLVFERMLDGQSPARASGWDDD